MNCLEARKAFVGFWQKTLAGQPRAALLLHLRGCSSCDRSFRAFALTAPVLYSAGEPDSQSPAAPTMAPDGAHFDSPRAPLVVEYLPTLWRANRLLPAFLMAAAAVLALYFAVPSRMTFEDAIAAESPSVEVASLPATDSLFGQELSAQGATTADSDE